MGGRALPAELLLRGGRVLREGGWEDVDIAVQGGRIAAIGASLDGCAGPDTVVEELDGRWVLPGFHDSHVHPVQAGLEMNQCDLTGLSTLEEYLDAIGSYAAANPSRAWISGGGWSMDSFPGGVPSAAPLDRLLPDRPVFLPNRDHHSAWVNSRALELAGISAHTPDPADGRIERDASGNPTGALHEGAMALVGSLVPAPTSQDLMEALLTAQRHLHSVGIVGWQDALVGDGLGMPDSLPTYIAARGSGALTAKVVLAQWWDRDRGLEQLPSLIERRALAAQAGLDAGSVKLMQDGVCETHTAAMLSPYLDAHGRLTDNRGLSFIPADALATYVAALDEAGFQAHIHALGDRAVRDSLDAISHARATNGASGLRHHLAHVQVVDPSDVPRFAALEVTANIQPLWACLDEAVEVLTLPFLAPAAREQQYVFGSLLRTGARIACGSDWPVSDPAPLLGMHVAVNRRSPEQPADAAPLLPEEALSVAEALAGYTTGTAYVNRLERSTGRIETGYAADLVVVDHDILGTDTTVLGRTRVTHTYVDGREVHRR
ncbi:amidohydrolase [Nocardioides luteus]|uniref:Amidohydrolase n=1 Tax=Nocardioides luteus TaxID=1844 RepID=A0A1J4N020_9ACTN|nr:amidohydrolase [Nocardioides luteus]OIJ23864.1 amidohydrolase [Nocardioides luteus]